ATFTTNPTPDTTAPTKPGTPTLVSATTTSLSFNWTASTDNVAVTRYDVYRNGAWIGSTGTNSYSDSNLTAGTGYSYTAIAYDAAGIPAVASDPATLTTTPPPDVTPPSKPGLPALVSSTDTTLSFNWAASIDNVAVTRYDVYRNGAFIGSSATNS